MRELRRKIARRLSGELGSRVIHALLCLLRATMRIRVEGGEALAEIVRGGEGFIGIFWHSRLLMIPFVYPGRRMHVLISVHRDGEIIANVMRCFGFGLVRGSSSKGGAAAFREMKQLLRTGNDLAVTPDGPRGPAEVLKPGVAELTRIMGSPVVPVAFSSSRCLRLPTWDRFLVPLPFSRGVFILGEPLRYQLGEDQEAYRERLEAALREATARADDYYHRARRSACAG
jgi:hypothetical protein